VTAYVTQTRCPPKRVHLAATCLLSASNGSHRPGNIADQEEMVVRLYWLVRRESPNLTQPLETQLGSWQSRLARRAGVHRNVCAQRLPAPAYCVSRLNRIVPAFAGIIPLTVAGLLYQYSSAEAAGP
jgi:hypothetical protein